MLPFVFTPPTPPHTDYPASNFPFHILQKKELLIALKLSDSQAELLN